MVVNANSSETYTKSVKEKFVSSVPSICPISEYGIAEARYEESGMTVKNIGEILRVGTNMEDSSNDDYFENLTLLKTSEIIPSFLVSVWGSNGKF